MMQLADFESAGYDNLPPLIIFPKTVSGIFPDFHVSKTATLTKAAGLTWITYDQINGLSEVRSYY